jgi:peptide/nickel transport system substrate-binding protein
METTKVRGLGTLLLAAGAVAAVLLAVGGAGAEEPAPVSGGTVMVGIETEPPCLNLVLAACGTQATSVTVGAVLPGAFRQRPDLSFEPMLASSVDVQRPAARKPFSLTFHVNPAAVWSDGVPVTSDDFIFTWNALRDLTSRNLANSLFELVGYLAITQAIRVDDKTVTFQFASVYAPWKQLFATILPKHVLAATDLTQDWQTEIADPATHVPIGSGPFLVSEWNRGQSLTLVRNPRWWGPHAPYLDSIVFRPIADTSVELDAVRTGEVDVISPTTSVEVSELRTAPGIAVEEALANFKEQISFNTASAEMPLLAQSWFRQAVAYAVDRTAIVRTRFGTLDPKLEPLQSLDYLAQQPEYQADFARYVYSPDLVAQIMTAHGCVLGRDGIWSCGGVRASVGITTTEGNAARIATEQLLQLETRGAGIELVTQNLPADVIFSLNGVRGGKYQTALFAWSGTTTDPSDEVPLYACKGVSNYLAYCSQEATAAYTASQTELNERRRTLDVNAADAILANDVPSLPLFQRPDFVAHSTAVHGIVANAALAGPTWNLEDWWKAAG